MQIVFPVFSCQIAEFLWNSPFVRLPFPFQFCQSFFNVFPSAGLFIFRNQGFTGFFQFWKPVHGINGFLLIYLCHLFTKIPAACVDDEVFLSIGSFIHLDKMISSAKRSKAAPQVIHILQFILTEKSVNQRELFGTFRCTPNTSFSVWHGFPDDFIQFSKINVRLFNFGS